MSVGDAFPSMAVLVMTALLRSAVFGSAALLVVWLLVRLWPSMPASLRPWLWRIACLKFVVGLAALPVIMVPLLPAPSVITPNDGFERPIVPAPSAPRAVGLPPRSSHGTPVSITRVTEKTSQSRDYAALLFPFWLAIFGCLGLRTAVSWRRVAVIRRESRPLACPDANALLRQICSKLGVACVPELRTADIASPLLTGLLRPAILVPLELAGTATRDAWSWIFAHELAHVRRRDLAWSLLHCAVECLFFFNPLVWLTRPEWSLAQEAACDAEALRVMQLPAADYARLLVSIADRRESDGLPALGVMDSFRSLERRIAMLQYARTPSRRRFVLSSLLVAVAGGLCLTPWAVTAQTDAKKLVTEIQPERRLFYPAVNLRVDHSSLHRALQELLKPTQFNYLYADSELGSEVSAHFSNMPLNIALDTLGKYAFKWGVSNNILHLQPEPEPVAPADRSLYSAHVRLTPLADTLQVLKIIHPFRFRIEGDATQVIETQFERVAFNEALAEILAHCETPMKSRQVGDTLVLSPDPARPHIKKAGIEPAAIIGKAPATLPIDPNAPRRYNMSGHNPFDVLVVSGFKYLGKPVRIAPTVTDSDELIDFNQTGTFDEMLSALIATHPGHKSPLTYRLEDGVYVIEPKEPPAKNAEIVFPKTPGESDSRADYVIENRPLGDALRVILEQTGESYWLCVPNSDKTVTMRLKNATVAQALRAALRTAMVKEPLRIAREKQLYCVGPRRMLLYDADFPNWKFTGSFHGVSAWDAFMLAFTPLGNYTIDDHVKGTLITTAFKDRTWDQALSDMTRGASLGIVVENKGNTMFVRAQ